VKVTAEPFVPARLISAEVAGEFAASPIILFARLAIVIGSDMWLQNETSTVIEVKSGSA